MTTKIIKENEDADTKDTLLDELDELNKDEDETPDTDASTDTSTDDDATDDDTPEDNIVDMFTKGDMDAVKAHIHDKVVMTVSDIINDPSSMDDEPETSTDEDDETTTD